MSVGNEIGPTRWLMRPALAFALASLLTILLGTVVMAQGDVPLGIWIRNPIAWLVSLAAGIFLSARGWLVGWAAPAALAIVALSFLGPEQEGVHRWLDLGAVQLNAAALVLPVAIAAFIHERAWLASSCFVLIAVALAWQPDISQLTGFAAASIILGSARFGWKGGVAALVVAAAAIALCLSRPDPLAPVAHVEGIFSMAWVQSPAIAIAMAVALAGTALSPVLLWGTGRVRWASLALTAYFAVTALAILVGAYPAPLAGYGLSFVVGWTLGFAALFPASRVNSLTSA